MQLVMVKPKCAMQSVLMLPQG